MTKETLYTLSTGDVVVNKDGSTAMIAVISPKVSGILTIDDLLPNLENWELSKSRQYVSEAELRKIDEYHKKLKEATAKVS